MRLKITNETDYRTSDLRRFLTIGFREEGVNLKEEWGRYVIKFYRPRGSLAGQAQYNIRWMRLALRDSEGELSPNQITRLAQVFVHELGHNRGEKHRDMVSSGTLPVPWAEGLRIRKKVVKPKPKRDIVAERAEHAAKMLRQHETKLRREEKLVKKWAQKVKYYGRVLAARYDKRAACKEKKEEPEKTS